jgi:uncharacterized BrkB/YihY/UPF0761 family membrane protein
LVFFYITAIIFIFGAEFNAVWGERTPRRLPPRAVHSDGDDTEAPPRRARASRDG